MKQQWSAARNGVADYKREQAQEFGCDQEMAGLHQRVQRLLAAQRQSSAPRSAAQERAEVARLMADLELEEVPGPPGSGGGAGKKSKKPKKKSKGAGTNVSELATSCVTASAGAAAGAPAPQHASATKAATAEAGTGPTTRLPAESAAENVTALSAQAATTVRVSAAATVPVSAAATVPASAAAVTAQAPASAPPLPAIPAQPHSTSPAGSQHGAWGRGSTAGPGYRRPLHSAAGAARPSNAAASVASGAAAAPLSAPSGGAQAYNADNGSSTGGTVSTPAAHTGDSNAHAGAWSHGGPHSRAALHGGQPGSSMTPQAAAAPPPPPPLLRRLPRQAAGAAGTHTAAQHDQHASDSAGVRASRVPQQAGTAISSGVAGVLSGDGDAGSLDSMARRRSAAEDTDDGKALLALLLGTAAPEAQPAHLSADVTCPPAQNSASAARGAELLPPQPPSPASPPASRPAPPQVPPIAAPAANIFVHSAEPPADLCCPITMALLSDPVLAADGFMYSRTAIEGWLAGNGSSPMTGAPLPSRVLTPCHPVRSMVLAWAEQHGF